MKSERDKKRERIKTCAEVIQWARAADHRFGRWTYGSENIFFDPLAKSALFHELCRRHMERTGYPADWTEDGACQLYSSTRKGNHKKLKVGKPILVPAKLDPQIRLCENDDIDTACVVYTYIGSIPRDYPRSIKIGFTTQLITRMCQAKVGHDPVLLATRCGGKQEEDKEHYKFRMQKLDWGKEWFRPVPAMLSHFKDVDKGWHPEPDIDSLFNNILKKWDKYENQ